MPLVAIVGRPNVGKSTLYNRLTEQRQAIVDDQPGVTRDRVYGDAEWNGRTFDVVDTGGFVPHSADRFEAAIREQVHIALEEADVLLFVVDVTTGITDLDEEMASVLRRTEKPVLIVANKSDNPARRLDASEMYRLGVGEVFPISAMSGSGTGDLLDALVEALPPAEDEPEEGEAPRIAFIGRPNVGKSSLANRLLGEERSIVTEISGTTRDAIDARLTYNGRDVVLVDTAGLRRKARVKENVEFYSTLRTERALRSADVAVIMVDGALGLETQDARIMQQAADLKKGMVIAINKWDLVEKETNTARDVERALRERLGLLDFVPIVFISALTGQRATKVLDVALQVADERHRRIPTAELNEALDAAVQAHHPPASGGRLIKIKYTTQVRANPPVFAYFCNIPQGVPESYRRYLENQLRKRFGFEGVPLTLSFKRK